MKFNINKLLVSASFILDFIEMDILNDITNHGKRVAYLAYKLGEKYNFTDDEKTFDMTIASDLHDIGKLAIDKYG